ncbi:MAG: DUF2232 domain-containing protein [Beijerinckiaceae bacterium]
MTKQVMLAHLSSLGIAIGAGLASALLFVVSAKGTLPALLLAYFSPLPLMIATLGFGQWTGLVGALLGSGLVAVTLSATAGPFYAIGLALPAWVVCVVALRGAPAPEIRPSAQMSSPADPNPAPQRALAVATLIFSLSVSAGALIVGALNGGVEAALNLLADQLTPLLSDLKSGTTSFPEDLDPARLARFLARLMVPAMAGSGLTVMMVNLWLAGRTVQISGRLPTRWPDVPYNLRLPVPFAAALVPAIGLIFLRGEIGFIASIVAAALATALSLQGLAVMHDLTRGMSARTPILFVAYLVMSFIPPWPLAIFAIVGLADAALGLRERKRLRQSAPPSPP